MLMKQWNRDSATVGRHYWDGACLPSGRTAWMETFSVGCFECMDGKRFPKKGKVKVRVKGPANLAAEIYDHADAICDALDRGDYRGPKTFVVKWKDA